MANDLAKLQATAVDVFVSRLGERISNYTQIADVITTDTPNLTLADFHGTTEFAAQTDGTDPSSQDFDSNKYTVASVAYEKLHKTSLKSLRDSPNLIQDIPAMLADAAAWTIADKFWTVCAGLPALNHPGQGDNYGESDKYIDTFAAPVAQGNKLTAALSESSLADAMKIMHAYKNKAGLPAGISTDLADLRLVVPPALAATAYDITNGNAKPGSTLTSGRYNGMPVVVMPEASDDSDWLLFNRPLSPIVVWVRSAPTLLVQEKLGHVDFYSQLECAVLVKPWEGGVVMSVAA